jgi:hypothetical protein
MSASLIQCRKRKSATICPKVSADQIRDIASFIKKNIADPNVIERTVFRFCPEEYVVEDGQCLVEFEYGGTPKHRRVYMCPLEQFNQARQDDKSLLLSIYDECLDIWMLVKHRIQELAVTTFLTEPDAIHNYMIEVGTKYIYRVFEPVESDPVEKTETILQEVEALEERVRTKKLMHDKSWKQFLNDAE